MLQRDLGETRKIQDQLDSMTEHENRKRPAKKARAKIIANCRSEMNRTRDPDSGDDVEGSAGPS